MPACIILTHLYVLSSHDGMYLPHTPACICLTHVCISLKHLHVLASQTWFYLPHTLISKSLTHLYVFSIKSLYVLAFKLLYALASHVGVYQPLTLDYISPHTPVCISFTCLFVFASHVCMFYPHTQVCVCLTHLYVFASHMYVLASNTCMY